VPAEFGRAGEEGIEIIVIRQALRGVICNGNDTSDK
jgi:hypothetical protein